MIQGERHAGSRSDAPVRPVSFEVAFSALFEERFATLYRYLHRTSGDAALADDVAQESFVRLYQRGSMPEDPPAWLVAVANNLVRDERRKLKRRAMLLLRRGGDDESPPVPSADAGVLSQERVAAVRQALDRLSLRDRQMLVLRHEGYSYREIADALGIANSSVGTLLVRATAAFAAAVEGEEHASD